MSDETKSTVPVIKTTAGTIMDAAPAVEYLLRKEWGWKEALKLADLAAVLEAAWTPLENARSAFAKRLAGEAPVVPPEKMNEYGEGLVKLRAETREIQAAPVVLRCPAELKLSAEVVRCLRPFVSFVE